MNEQCVYIMMLDDPTDKQWNTLLSHLKSLSQRELSKFYSDVLHELAENPPPLNTDNIGRDQWWQLCLRKTEHKYSRARTDAGLDHQNSAAPPSYAPQNSDSDTIRDIKKLFRDFQAELHAWRSVPGGSVETTKLQQENQRLSTINAQNDAIVAALQTEIAQIRQSNANLQTTSATHLQESEQLRQELQQMEALKKSKEDELLVLRQQQASLTSAQSSTSGQIQLQSEQLVASQLRIEQLTAEVTAYQARIQTLEADISASSAKHMQEIHAMTEQTTTMQSQQAALQKQIHDVQSQLNQTLEEKRLLELAIETNKNRIQALEQAQDQQNQSLDQTQLAAREKTQELEKYSEEISQLHAQIIEKETAMTLQKNKLESEIHGLESQIQVLSMENQDKSTELAAKVKTETDLRSELQQVKDAATLKETELQHRIILLETEIQTLGVDESVKFQSLMQEKVNLENQLRLIGDDAKAKETALQTQIDQLINDKQILVLRQTELEQQQASLNSERMDLKNQIAALEGKLENDAQHYQVTIMELENANKDYNNQIDVYVNEIGKLQTQKKKLKEELTALQQNSGTNADQLRAKEKEIEDKETEIQGLNSKILEMRKEIEKNLAEIHDKETLIKDAKTESERLNTELFDTKLKVMAASDEIRKKDESIAVLNREKDALEGTVSGQETQLIKLQNELGLTKNLQKQKDDLQKRVDALQSEKDKFTTDMQKLEKDKEDELATKDKEIAKLNASLRKSAFDSANIDKIKKDLQDNIDALESENKKIKKTSEYLESEAASERSRLQEQLKDKANVVAGFQSTMAAQSVELDKLRRQVADQATKITDADKAITEIHSLNESLKDLGLTTETQQTIWWRDIWDFENQKRLMGKYKSDAKPAKTLGSRTFEWIPVLVNSDFQAKSAGGSWENTTLNSGTSIDTSDYKHLHEHFTALTSSTSPSWVAFYQNCISKNIASASSPPLAATAANQWFLPRTPNGTYYINKKIVTDIIIPQMVASNIDKLKPFEPQLQRLASAIIEYDLVPAELLILMLQRVMNAPAFPLESQYKRCGQQDTIYFSGLYMGVFHMSQAAYIALKVEPGKGPKSKAQFSDDFFSSFSFI